MPCNSAIYKAINDGCKTAQASTHAKIPLETWEEIMAWLNKTFI
jgi:hypothetical protein